jgi:uncharacterized protein (TIGR02246 family)
MDNTRADDIAAIRDLVAAAQRLQSEVDGFLALHTDDVTIVNLGGRRVRGRAAVRDAMQAALASPLADVTTTLDVDHVRFVGADVAVVECTKHVHDGRAPGVDGDPFADRGMLTFVVTRTGGGPWRINLAQTTPVAA